MNKDQVSQEGGDKVNARIGHKLRVKRHESGLSAQDFAKLLNVSAQQVYNYERGSNKISASALYKVCQAFSIDPNWFYSDLESSDLWSIDDHKTIEQDLRKELLLLYAKYIAIKNPDIRKIMLQIMDIFK